MLSLADRALALRLGLGNLDYTPSCNGTTTCPCFWCESVAGMSMRERSVRVVPKPEPPKQPWQVRAA